MTTADANDAASPHGSDRFVEFVARLDVADGDIERRGMAGILDFIARTWKTVASLILIGFAVFCYWGFNYELDTMSAFGVQVQPSTFHADHAFVVGIYCYIYHFMRVLTPFRVESGSASNVIPAWITNITDGMTICVALIMLLRSVTVRNALRMICHKPKLSIWGTTSRIAIVTVTFVSIIACSAWITQTAADDARYDVVNYLTGHANTIIDGPLHHRPLVITFTTDAAKNLDPSILTAARERQLLFVDEDDSSVSVAVQQSIVSLKQPETRRLLKTDLLAY